MPDMILRLLVALVGAAIVTTGLLLGMDAVTSLFREEDGERLYRITDILPRPAPGRPERPAPAQRQPDVPEAEAEVGLPGESMPVELPQGFAAPDPSPPQLEPPAEPASPTSPDN